MLSFTTLDGAWNPNWGKAPLVRPFRLEGDSLVISGAPGRDPVTGDEVAYRMEFRKVKAASASGPDIALPDEMLRIAEHIMQAKTGDFDPALEDRSDGARRDSADREARDADC
jgi:hypothetical protein